MKYKYTFLKNRLFYDEILIPYLDRMSKKGWNLVSVNSFFKFEKSSQVYKYQVDYNPLTDDYLETLDHLGYEHVCCLPVCRPLPQSMAWHTIQFLLGGMSSQQSDHRRTMPTL